MNEHEEDYLNWYTLQVQNLRELKVKETIEIKINNGLLKSVIDIYVPTREVISISAKGKKSILTKPIYPGYVFIKMNFDKMDVVELLSLPFTQKFIGTKTDPVVMSIPEAKKILSFKDKVIDATYRITFEVGDNVRITEGAFAEYKGEVKDINHEQNEANVVVKILGRETVMKVPLHDLQQIED